MCLLLSESAVDIATLTGAQLVATGLRHAAVVSRCEAWEAAAVRAGAYSGDLAHPLPYCPEFFRSEFASKARHRSPLSLSQSDAAARRRWRT